jgi:hypothetical protein
MPEMICFGSFEPDLEIKTLPRRGYRRKHGLRVRFEGQSFEASAVLLETPGR